MSFQAPLFLLGLAVVPLALAALVARPAAPGALRRALPGRPDAGRRRCPRGAAGAASSRPALLCLALAGLALALARPEATVAVPVERASVVLVTDTSGSMEATDVAPSRLGAAKAAAERFLDRVPDELQVGLVATRTRRTPSCARPRIASRCARRWPAWSPTAAPRPATRSPARCAPSASAAKDAPPAAIVLLSDGATTAGRDPAAVAREAGAADVPVYTVALGTPTGTVADARRARSCPCRPTRTRCARSPELSGGRAFAAEDADALDEVYEGLGSRIGTREERREISAGFAAAGLLLLAGAVVTALRWRGRLP